MYAIKTSCPADSFTGCGATLVQALGKNELEIPLGSFERCDRTHTITDARCELDQIDHISRFSHIRSDQPTTGQDDDEADAMNAKLFQSLVLATVLVLALYGRCCCLVACAQPDS